MTKMNESNEGGSNPASPPPPVDGGLTPEELAAINRSHWDERLTS
jgi:hypothetical protein